MKKVLVVFCLLFSLASFGQKEYSFKVKDSLGFEKKLRDEAVALTNGLELSCGPQWYAFGGDTVYSIYWSTKDPGHLRIDWARNIATNIVSFDKGQIEVWSNAVKCQSHSEAVQTALKIWGPIKTSILEARARHPELEKKSTPKKRR